MVVDDDPGVAEIVESIGTDLGFDTQVFSNAKDFISACGQSEPRVIVLDIFMPDMDGIELLKWISTKKVASAIIVMSGYGEHYIHAANLLGKAKGVMIHETLKKPFSIAKLQEVLRQFLDGH